MNISLEQFNVFVACLSIGCVFGLTLPVSNYVKDSINNQYFKILLDVLMFLVYSFTFILLSYSFNFPNARLYMYFAVFLGCVIGYKTFNLTLAKLLKRLYNKIKKSKGRTKDERVET